MFHENTTTLDRSGRSGRSVGTVDFMEPSRILVIEDDTRIGSSLTRALEGSGYVATWAQTANEGIAAFKEASTREDPFRLVLLDLGLPDGNGLDVCRTLVAADPLVPVVILTARADELDSVVGLDAGAVDYVTKPFTLSPLLARIRAQLRRTDQTNTTDKHLTSVITMGALCIHRDARRVTLDGNEIALRPKEFDLLTRLSIDAGSAVTRETLMNDVWDTEWFGSTKTLDFHIAALRTKLDPVGGPTIITTIRGVGFRLEK
jgi:DNA-binding response OmpR family regulator